MAGSWDGKLALSVTILGRSGGVEPVRRSGAKVGDGIYVTGPLGGSIGGRHMTFTPRVREARELVARYRVNAMIDLSDGLSRDLAHVCRESGVGAVVRAAAVPVHADAKGDLRRALNDGEDYELLFASPDAVPVEMAMRIGDVIAGRELWLEVAGERAGLPPGAWEHRL